MRVGIYELFFADSYLMRVLFQNSNPHDAAIVEHDEIIGKCILTMNWVALLLEAIKTPTGIIKVILLPALFLVTVWLALKYLKMVKIVKTEELEKAKKEE